MNIYRFINIPQHALDGFKPVRSTAQNLYNTLYLAEVLSMYSSNLENAEGTNFDIALYLGKTKRSVVKSPSGYFSMHFPFSIVQNDGFISYNLDYLERPLNSALIYQVKTCLDLISSGHYVPDDIIFSLHESHGLSFEQAMDVYELMFYLLSLDHGYFRFDDDQERANGRIHPRYHFDFFFKSQTTFKIGCEQRITPEFFTLMFDKDSESPYLES